MTGKNKSPTPEDLERFTAWANNPAVEAVSGAYLTGHFGPAPKQEESKVVDEETFIKETLAHFDKLQPAFEAVERELFGGTMNEENIEATRDEGMRAFDRLNNPNTTVYAVAHARDPRDIRKESIHGDGYDSAKVLSAFAAIFPRQQAAFNTAMKRFNKI